MKKIWLVIIVIIAIFIVSCNQPQLYDDIVYEIKVSQFVNPMPVTSIYGIEPLNIEKFEYIKKDWKEKNYQRKQ